MFGHVFVCFVLFAGSIFAQDCMMSTKPQIQRFGITPSNDIQINGTFKGEVANCIWYVNGMKNTTTMASSVSDSMIRCSVPQFLQALQGGMATGPPTGFPSLSPQQKQMRLDLEVQVYYKSATNKDDSNCFSSRTLVAGGGLMPTLVPSGTPGFDCDWGACFKPYNASISMSNGNISIICAAAEMYLRCLNALKNCANKRVIDSEKQVAMDQIKNNPCRPMTQAPTSGPTPSEADDDDTTRPPLPTSPTPKPAVSERDLATCCAATSHNDSVDPQCRTICAQVFDQGFFQRPSNISFLPQLEMICRKDMRFEKCLRRQLDVPPTISVNAFRKDIQMCCQNKGSSECRAACNNFASGSANPVEIVQKCLRQGSSEVGMCFADVVEDYYDVELPSERCCNNSECASQCQRAFDDFWGMGALAISDPERLALNQQVTQLKYRVSGSCSNNDVIGCIYGDDDDDDDDDDERPFFFGPSDKDVQNAIISCCNKSVARNRACQDICEELLDDSSSQSPRHLLACFEPDESKFVQCVAKENRGTAVDLRAFFRNIVQDRYRGDRIDTCCDLATDDTCENLCDGLSSRKVAPSNSTWINTCRNNANEKKLLQCYANIRYGQCQGACDRLDYCSNFNNRPFDYRMGGALCGPLGDSLAAALHDSWVDDGTMRILDRPIIKLKDVNTCRPDFFKSLACFLIAKPCQDDNDLSLLCQDECVAAFTECKAANESRSAANICKLLGASQTQCWNLASSFGQAASPIKVNGATVTVVLSGWKWTPLLNLVNSRIYSEISEQIELEVEKILSQLPGKQNIKIVGFSKGPQDQVQVSFNITSRGTNPATFAQIRDILKQAAGAGVQNPRLGNLPVAPDTLAIVGDAPSDESPTSGAGMTSASLAVITTLILSVIFGRN